MPRRERVIFAIIFTLPFLGWVGYRIYWNYVFERDCGVYLKRVAQATTIPSAIENLDISVKYLESNALNWGYTSIFWKTPDENVGAWYASLKASLVLLRRVSTDASQEVKSDALMKLRKVVSAVPQGISVLPVNLFIALWGSVTGVLMVIFVVSAIRSDE